MADCEKIMRELTEEIATNLQYKNYELKLKPISTEGANFTTDLFIGTISAPGKENIEIFGKVANLGDETREKIPVDELFTTERYFYTDLLKKYEKLQDKCKVPEEHKIKVAKYYTSTSELYKETLVLENLLPKGYTLYDRLKSVDWEYASKSIEELAKFHAVSMAFGEENPEDYKKILSVMKPVQDINFIGKIMIDAAVNAVDESKRDKVNIFLRENIFQKGNKYYNPLRRPVLVHGDYRPSNLMHKVASDGTIEIVILDFQTMQAGCAIMDLLYFIFNCTDEEFRREYYEKLIEHYYTELRLALQRFHLNPDKVYPREDFEYELEEMMPFGLSIAALLLQFVTADNSNLPKLDEKLIDAGVKTSELFSERLNGVINDYIRWGIL